MNTENIKYVLEDIGYSRASIYQWRKRYLKESTLGIMNNKNISSGEIKERITPAEANASSSHEWQILKIKYFFMISIVGRFVFFGRLPSIYWSSEARNYI